MAARAVRRAQLVAVGVAAALMLLRYRRLRREAASGASAQTIWRRPSGDAPSLAHTLEAIIARAPSLRWPSYQPTVWASGAFSSMLAFCLRCQLWKWLRLAPPLRQLLFHRDGSITRSWDCSRRAKTGPRRPRDRSKPARATTRPS